MRPKLIHAQLELCWISVRSWEIKKYFMIWIFSWLESRVSSHIEKLQSEVFFSITCETTLVILKLRHPIQLFLKILVLICTLRSKQDHDNSSFWANYWIPGTLTIRISTWKKLKVRVMNVTKSELVGNITNMRVPRSESFWFKTHFSFRTVQCKVD